MKTHEVLNDQRGFTLLELLFVVGILGLIAAVVIPNMLTFFGVGNMTAANDELQNIRTAAVGYYGEYHFWPASSSNLTAYVSSSPRAHYAFDTTTGVVRGVSDVHWSGIRWDSENGKWAR